MRRELQIRWLVGAALALLTACVTPGTPPAPHAGATRGTSEELLFAAVPEALRADGDSALVAGLALVRPEARAGEGDFGAPQRLRPCCAFGHDLAVGMGPVPLPGWRLDNVLEPGTLGQHRYDAGILALANGVRRGFVSPERNGLVYTLRGGFVDLAHVRGYADWTVYLAHRIADVLPRGGSIHLPDEGGRRTLRVEAVSPPVLERVGRLRLAVALAQRIAWQLSLWHEAATWYGWSSVAVFPERVSAFSPEDLYSNAVGIRLAGALLRAGGARTRAQYEANMDGALPEILARLGAVSAQCSRVAVRLVDRIWWDSRRHLPRADLVLERNFQTGPELVPWRVALPDSGHGDAAATPRGPLVLRVAERLDGLELAALAGLEIEPDAEPARRALGSRLRGHELEEAVRRLRAEAAARTEPADG